QAVPFATRPQPGGLEEAVYELAVAQDRGEGPLATATGRVTARHLHERLALVALVGDPYAPDAVPAPAPNERDLVDDLHVGQRRIEFDREALAPGREHEAGRLEVHQRRMRRHVVGPGDFAVD